MIPKNLIKELCKREGKKVQVSRGNVMEILARLADIFADRHETVLAGEFLDQVALRVKKVTKQHVSAEMNVKLLGPVEPKTKVKKKTAKKKTAKKKK